MLVATRFRLRDLWITEVFAVIYLAFNITWYYTAAKGTKVIYSILNWGHAPAKATIYAVVVLLVLIPLIDCFHFGVFR